MFATEFIRDEVEMDNHALYHTLWVVDEYLEELIELMQRIEFDRRLLKSG